MFRRSTFVLATATLLAAVTPMAVEAGISRRPTAFNTTSGVVDNLADIYPGGNSSEPYPGVNLGARHIFVATNATYGRELWITDGTTSGTSILKDINPGSDGSSPTVLTRIGDRVYFAAYNAVYGNEVWVTDGTPSGTNIVKDVYTGGNNFGGNVTYPNSSQPRSFNQLGNLVIFAANDATYGDELWVTDGTWNGTTLLKDINPGAGHSNTSGYVTLGNKLYFRAQDGTTGYELWVTDGTPSGTTLVKDIYPGAGNSGNPNFMTRVGDKFVFRAIDSVGGEELWVSDGTAANTVLLKDINTGSANSSPDDLTAVGQYVLFTATDGTNGRELWRTDGTASGTSMLSDIEPGANGSYPERLDAIGDTLYFFANETTTGTEPYVSDGTSAGTHILADINPGSGWSKPYCSGMCMFTQTESYFTKFGDSAVFFANHPTLGSEPFISDGTSTGTRVLVDLRMGASGSYWLPYMASGLTTLIVALEDKVMFVADNGSIGAEFWVLTSSTGVPQNVAAAATSNGATVSWQAPSSPVARVGSYVVTSNPGGFTCTTSSLSCTVTGLLSNQDYTFTVTATSSLGTSQPSPASPRVRTPSPQLGSLVGSLTSVADIVSDPNLRAGDPLTVLYRGFNPSELVLLMLASNPVVIGSANADANGNVAFTTAVPTGTTAGAHHLLIYAPVSGFGASQAVTVTAAASGSSSSSSAGSSGSSTSGTVDPSSLPATGRGDAPAVFALYVLVAGLLAMRLRRRALPVRGNRPR